ncbi:Uncharacterised protein [Raoultella terrigena]|uniref:Uncharacterized protein n=1 Tax=Raoultella terrigena TaxID=577 RepID=A0A7Z8ZCP3_RAOTE|nr:Uncharacterised protein [Raoultella terrigena]
MTNTYDYLNTLIISFENNYHMPLLQTVNNAHVNRHGFNRHLRVI